LVVAPDGDGEADAEGDGFCEGETAEEGAFDGTGDVPKIVGVGTVLGVVPDGVPEGEVPDGAFEGEVDGEGVGHGFVTGNLTPSCWKSNCRSCNINWNSCWRSPFCPAKCFLLCFCNA